MIVGKINLKSLQRLTFLIYFINQRNLYIVYERKKGAKIVWSKDVVHEKTFRFIKLKLKVNKFWRDRSKLNSKFVRFQFKEIKNSNTK